MYWDIRIAKYLILLISIVSMSVHGAFCSLRTPSESIKKLFPAYSHYQTIVAKVTRDNRNELKKTLPFKFHFNEVGRHSLYFVKNEDEYLGFVHARSELAPWGMMEIAWAFDMDLRIENVEFRRCRSSLCNERFIGEFLLHTKGKGIPELLEHFQKKYPSSNFALDSSPARRTNIVNQKDSTFNKELDRLMLKSAIKTLVLTQISWKEQVTQLRKDQLLDTAFAPALNKQYYPVSISKLKEHGLVYLNAGSRVTDKNEAMLGYVAETHWEAEQFSEDIVWVFDENGTLKDVAPDTYWPNREIEDLFLSMKGKNFSSEEGCANALELSAHELYASLSRV